MLLGILFVSYSSRGHQLVFCHPKTADNNFLGFDTTFLADILSPKTALCDKQFLLRVDKVDFVGHPTLLNVDRPGTGLIYSRKIQKSILNNTNLSPLTMFHLVFAMGNCERGEIDLVYDHCLMKVTAGFKFEQLRRGYILQETEIILKVKDNYLKEHENDNGKIGSVECEILDVSSLARTLMQVFNAMVIGEGKHIIINNSVRVSLQNDLTKLRAIKLPITAGTFKTILPTLRPYHSLLLLQDIDQILSLLPRDSSPFLIRLIQSVRPTSSFEQLQTTLNATLSQIYKFASHLHYWGLAKIIQTLSTRNIYVVNDKATFSNIGRLSAEFSSRFAPLELISLLKNLSLPRPFHSSIPSKDFRDLYLDGLSYLLRHELVVQLHMYLCEYVLNSTDDTCECGFTAKP